MIQHGQVFKLKTKGADGHALWAYRYRLEGRGSERPQVGGFATREEAEKALRKVLDRLGPGGGRATITLADFVDEYLQMHQAAPVTIAKLRWFLGKATAELGETRLADLSPRNVYAWRMTVPEGIASRRRRRSGRCSTVPLPGDCSTSTRRRWAATARRSSTRNSSSRAEHPGSSPTTRICGTRGSRTGPRTKASRLGSVA